MSQLVEIAWDSLCKHGEELCGDWVKITTTPDDLIVVLSDGLGSGVKANILATLTTEIAGTMLVRGASIDEVVETLADTLPECQVRHLAYATFAVLRVVHGREAYLAEYDSPPLILVRGGQVVDLPMTEREIAGRKIREGTLHAAGRRLHGDGQRRLHPRRRRRTVPHGLGLEEHRHLRAALGGNARRYARAGRRPQPDLPEAVERRPGRRCHRQSPCGCVRHAGRPS